ncbi:MAG: hypothetical protein HPY65_08115 [Syntrophaceae bacterium]|nr:hypothetical protein [Syntrophaceae bacterium]
MKHGIGALLVALAVVCSVMPAAAESGDGGKTRIYQVSWQGGNVSGRLMINGFTVSEFKGGPVTGTAAVNIWLTGGNEIKAVLGKKDLKAPANFSVGVSELFMGDITSTGDRGKLLNMELTDADLSGGSLKAVSRTFQSDLDFSSHLLSAKPSRFREKEVLEYAVRFYGLFRKKDAGSILQAMAVKVEDYARAYGRPPAEMKEGLASMLKEDIFKSRLAVIDRRKLKASKVNNLWHIYDGSEELIRSKSTDGSTSELPVFIGDIDGKLMVVR